MHRENPRLQCATDFLRPQVASSSREDRDCRLYLDDSLPGCLGRLAACQPSQAKLPDLRYFRLRSEEVQHRCRLSAWSILDLLFLLSSHLYLTCHCERLHHCPCLDHGFFVFSLRIGSGVDAPACLKERLLVFYSDNWRADAGMKVAVNSEK